MTKTEETKRLERNIWEFTHQHAYIYGAFEVTIGYIAYGGKGYDRADYVTVGTDGTIRSYELKTSVSDFNSKAKLSWIGHYNYLVVTKEVYAGINSQRVDWLAGIIVDDGEQGMRIVRKPHKQQRSVGQSTEIVESVMKAAVRDATKFYRKEWSEQG